MINSLSLHPEKNHMKHCNPSLHHHNEMKALDSLTLFLKKLLKHPDITEEKKLFGQYSKILRT